jgi:hypothetical protein
LPTRSVWQFWASETLQKRLSNASVTLQKRLTSGLHALLDMFIHCGRFHGQWTRRCGALLARVRVRLAAPCATANPGFTPPPILETPCLKPYSCTNYLVLNLPYLVRIPIKNRVHSFCKGLPFFIRRSAPPRPIYLEEEGAAATGGFIRAF